MKKIFIVNSLGQKKPFSLKKVYRSARRVGASKSLAKEIAVLIESEAYPGISTKEIFQKARQILSKEYPYGGIRFSLKEGMRRMGPSGFPFEKYAGDVLEQLGYTLHYNLAIKGHCVFHEIDFLAKKDGKLLIGECKFHHLSGGRVDVKVALAHHARFLDLKTSSFLKDNFGDLELRPIIVTNTKFTSDAINYSQCMDIDLLGWKYPSEGSLESIIESKKLYPVTVLPSLRGNALEVLSREKMMLAKDLLDVDPVKFSRKAGLPENIVLSLRKEAEMLLKE